MTQTADPLKAEIAGLLHDCAKEFSEKELLKLGEKYGYHFEDYELKAPQVLHAVIGPYIAKEKYRAGEGLMLDIIDTQLALSTAQLNHISAQYDYARYKAEVENAMGISLTDKEPAAADRLLADEVK